MKVQFTPETEAELIKLAALRGCGTDQLIEDAVVEYITVATLDRLDAEMANSIRATLNRRYDEMVNGTVKMIDGEEVFERLRQKSELRRAAHK